ncbi:MAG TPA: DUF418 domain-containing protein [Croceibacterium sp.]|nr:DUF418 domain-containing protein [Croceibacterium sp.]
MNATAAKPDQADPALSPGTSSLPVGSDERIVALDFIRGIAVLGILFPNIVAHGYPVLAYYWPEGLAGGSTAFDRWVWLFQYVLIDGKLRGLFTLLFGAGVYLFMERAWARGATRALQVRRLAWLALFGLAHFYLVWFGDILFLYAVSGFAVLAMIGWPARRQLRVGLVWWIVGALFLTAALASQAAPEILPDGRSEQPKAYAELRKDEAKMTSDAAANIRAMREGGYGEVVAYRARTESSTVAKTPFIAVIETIPLMLVGMALYRLGLFSGGFDPARMRRWGWIGFAGGALLSLPLGLWAMAAGFPLMLTQFVFNGASQLLHLPMILGLAALLTLWAPAASRTWLGSRIVAAGRMAFSNYLGTSVVMMLVFQGWAGIGLYGELHRDGLLLIVLAAWALMLAWSRPWLARFRYGPLEWLWRCLTYGRRFPFRR